MKPRWQVIVSKLIVPLALLVALCSPRDAWAHNQWAVIDGTAATPTVTIGSVRLQVVRLAPGYYQITFATPVQHVLVTSQSRGPGGDASSTLASVVRDTNPRVVYVSVRAIGNGTPAGTTLLTPVNAWLSIAIQR